MTEAEYDNGLSDYEWHEEDEREQVFFVSLKKQKTVLEMIAGQNKEPASHNVQLICS